jgi:hypothetical protein
MTCAYGAVTTIFTASLAVPRWPEQVEKPTWVASERERQLGRTPAIDNQNVTGHE